MSKTKTLILSKAKTMTKTVAFFIVPALLGQALRFSKKLPKQKGHFENKAGKVFLIDFQLGVYKSIGFIRICSPFCEPKLIFCYTNNAEYQHLLFFFIF